MKTGFADEGLARFEGSRFGFSIIRLCRGMAGGRRFYAFLAIEPHNLDYFRQRYQDNLADFSAFGTELLRGWGDTPPQAIIDHMQDKFGVEFGVESGYVETLARMAAQQAGRDPAVLFPVRPLSAADRKTL